ncbi:MAG: YiiX/YebB-like N1pC/P60 family cysteine hydrolase [Akkermansiaceae bacterium]
MHKNEAQNDECKIERTMEQVVSAAQAIPQERDLTAVIEDSVRASARSYYLPDEDDRLRSVFAAYLRARSILVESIDSIMPVLRNKLNWRNELRTFAVGFTAGCLLVRSTKYIITLARQNPVIWNKLDESELRYGIERKTISRLYESLSSTKKMSQFHHATRFFESSKPEILALAELSELDQELILLLIEESPFIESRKRDYLRLRLRYRIYDIVRRNSSGYKKAMFQLFRLTGSAVAELKQPMKKSNSLTKGTKRVTPEFLSEIRAHLIPGDIIITRHDDALSNLFLPGYWPHAAFYMGNPAQLETLKIPISSSPEHEIIESKKDGVKFRPLHETLNVDSFVVIRANLDPEYLSQAIQTAMSHAGKRYDFLFDFTKANRLACTELVYRAYHGVNGLQFSLNERSGRMCISAEDLIDQMIRSRKFDVHALFTEKTGKIIYQAEARAELEVSYSSQW